MIFWYLAQLLFWCGVIVLIVAGFLAVTFVPPYVAFLLVRDRLKRRDLALAHPHDHPSGVGTMRELWTRRN